MRDDEIALRSQQLSEQTGAREADALARQSAVFQRLPDTVTGFQQASMAAQRQHEEMLHSASDLANDELKRKQAMEDLQWAQQLHTTTAMEYQTRGLKAQTEFEEARLAKAKQDLGTDMGYGEFGHLDEVERASIISSTGKKFIPGHGGVTVVDATPEEREAAKGTVKRDRQEKMMPHVLSAAYGGLVPDLETGSWKEDAAKAKETVDRYQESRAHLAPFGTGVTNILKDAETSAETQLADARKIVDSKIPGKYTAEQKTQAALDMVKAQKRLDEVRDARQAQVPRVSVDVDDDSGPQPKATPPAPRTPAEEVRALTGELQQFIDALNKPR